MMFSARSLSPTRTFRAIEPLESRVVPASLTAHWIGTNGDWNNPANWDLGVVPNNEGPNTYTVIIDVPGGEFTITNTGSITISSLQSEESLTLSGGYLAVNSGASVINGGLTVGAGSTLTATGAGVTFTANGVTALGNANLYASAGAVLDLSEATSYASFASVIQADGPGSRIDLSGLDTFTNNTQIGGATQITALFGGVIDMSGASNISLSTVYVRAEGPGSIINVNAIASFTNTYTPFGADSSLTAVNGGSVLAGALKSLNNVSLDFDGTGTITAPQIVSFQNAPLTISAATPLFANVVNLSGAIVKATGGITLTLGSVINIDGASFEVSGNSTISAPLVTSYDTLGSNPAFKALGTGSFLDLGAVTSLQVTNGVEALTVEALFGGQIDLSSVVTYFGATLHVKADGPGSVVDLTAMTGWTTTNPGYTGPSHLQASNGGSVLIPNLANLSGVDIILDGTGTLPTAQIAFFQNGTVTIEGVAANFGNATNIKNSTFKLSGGGTVNLNNASNIDGASFLVSGGVTLVLPSATGYRQTADRTAQFQADGPGSRIDLPNVSNLMVPAHFPLQISALNGGTVELDSVNGMPGGRVEIKAQGIGSKVDLTALTSWSTTEGSISALTALNGGIVINPNLTNLNYVDLQFDDDSTLSTSQIVNFRNGTAKIDGVAADFSGALNISSSHIRLTGGGTVNLNNVTNIDGATFYVSGGVTLALPAVTNYRNINGFHTTTEVVGAGSKLDLSNVTNIYNDSIYTLSFHARDGGVIDLRQVQSISVGPVSLLADGPGSQLNLSALVSITADLFGRSNLGTTAGGNMVVPNLTTLRTASLNIDNATTFPVAQLVTLQNTQVNVNGVAVSFTGLTNALGSSFSTVGGGKITLPALTTYSAVGGALALRAEGTGSQISAPVLVTIDGSVNGVALTANTGGVLDLPAVTDLNGNVSMTIDGSQSRVNLPLVTSLTDLDLYLTNGAALTVPKNAVLRGAGGAMYLGAANSSLTTLINEGAIEWDVTGATLTISGNFTNKGALEVSSGAIIDVNGPLTLDVGGHLVGDETGILQVSGNLLGGTRSGGSFKPAGTVILDGAGTPANPQEFEVMSLDLGNVPAGFNGNFSYSRLVIGANNYVKLVNRSDNSGGPGAEALYVDELIISPGAILDTNGYQIYVRSQEVTGTLVTDKGKTATYTEPDGDTIIIKTDKGSLAAGSLVFQATAGGSVLQKLDLTDAKFSGATISIAVKSSNKTTRATASDEQVSIGEVDATGVTLKSFTLNGDVTSFKAGTEGTKKAAVGKVKLGSIGLHQQLFPGVQPVVNFANGVKNLRVEGDVNNTRVELGANVPVGGGFAALKQSIQVVGSILGSTVVAGAFDIIQVSGELKDSTVEVANKVDRFKVAGSVINTDIYVKGTLKTLGITGDMKDSNIFIPGIASAANVSKTAALASLGVKGSMENSQVLVGHSDAGPVRADAWIGKVKIGENFASSRIVVGVGSGADGFFGGDDDLLIDGGGSKAVIAKIASLTIGGDVTGASAGGHQYGVFAEQIGKVFHGSIVPIPMTAGAGNDLAPVVLTTGQNVYLREYAMPVPPVA